LINHTAVAEDVKKRLFEIYKETGADTDGNETFHTDVVSAFRHTLDAVRELRKDYNDLLDEQR